MKSSTVLTHAQQSGGERVLDGAVNMFARDSEARDHANGLIPPTRC